MVEIPTFVRTQKVSAKASAVRADPADFGKVGSAIAKFGESGSAAAATLEKVREDESARLQKLEDANFLLEKNSTFRREAIGEFERRRKEGDPSDPGFTEDFDRFLGDRIDEVLSSIPTLPNGRPAISADAQTRLRTNLAGVRESLFKTSLVTQRNAMEVKAAGSIEREINDLAADVTRAPGSGDLALAGLDDVLAGYAGTLPAAALDKARVGARSTIISARIRGLIDKEDFAGARGVLADENFDTDLDARNRQSLAAAVGVAERRAEALDAAARRQIEAGLRRDVSDAVFVLQRGKTPDGLQGLNRAVEGFPDLAEALTGAVADAEIMSKFVRQPPQGQAEAIRDLDRRKTLDRREVTRLAAMRTVQSESLRAIKQDAIGYAAQVEAIAPLGPVDFGDTESLRQRQEQTDSAAEFLGIGAISPLTPAETTGLSRAIDAAPGDQVTGLMQSLVGGFGEQGAEAIAGQLAPGRPALAVALSSATDSPLVASAIVRGERLARETKDVNPSSTEIEPLIADVYGGLFREVPRALAPHVAAAKAIYAARKVPTGDLAFDGDLFEESLILVAGGRLDGDGEVIGGPIDFNGVRVLPPRAGMDEAGLGDAVARLTPDDLIQFGTGAPVFADGTAFTADLFDAGLFEVDAQLLTTAPGRYRVFLPGLGYVITEAGNPYEIDLREFLDRRPAGGGVSVDLPPETAPGATGP